MSKKETVEIRFKESKKVYTRLQRISHKEGCSVPELYRQYSRKAIYSLQEPLPKDTVAIKSGPMTVHANDEEKFIIEKFSQEHGLSKSSTLRRCIQLLDEGHADLLPEEVNTINDAIRAVNKIGRNYNQHLKKIHTGEASGIPDKIIKAAIRDVKTLERSLRDFEEAVKNRKLPHD